MSHPSCPVKHQTSTPTRSQQLKAASHATHELLDQTIMKSEPFASRENFQKFLRVQLRFHHDIAALYKNPALAALIPDLAARQRLELVKQDLADLSGTPEVLGAPALGAEIDLPTALGWLYVSEGSNMGGAVLFKLAAKLGLNESFGARHLAAHPDGVLKHWREFSAALDAVPMSAQDEQRLVAAACAAFTRVHGHVAAVYEL